MAPLAAGRLLAAQETSQSSVCLQLVNLAHSNLGLHESARFEGGSQFFQRTELQGVMDKGKSETAFCIDGV